MMSLPLEIGDELLIRPWLSSDARSLAFHANNRNVWRNLRDGFPHPYTLPNAEIFLAKAPPTFFCISLRGEAIGGIGFQVQEDVARFSAELGYWLGEAFWSQKIVTRAVRAVTAYAVSNYQLIRVYALPYAWNPCSHRLLETCGFVLEGRLRKAVYKDGEFVDQLLYAYVVDGLGPFYATE